MIKEFDQAMDIIMARKFHKKLEKKNGYMLCRDFLAQIDQEFEYFSEMSDKLQSMDPSLFVYRMSVIRFDTVSSKRYYLSYRLGGFQAFHIQFNAEVTDDTLTFNTNILNDGRYSTGDGSSVRRAMEKAKMNAIKEAFKEELLNTKEFRLPYVTGALKIHG